MKLFFWICQCFYLFIFGSIVLSANKEYFDTYSFFCAVLSASMILLLTPLIFNWNKIQKKINNQNKGG